MMKKIMFLTACLVSSETSVSAGVKKLLAAIQPINLQLATHRREVELVEKLLKENRFSPEDLKKALKLAYAGTDEASGEKRTPLQSAQMFLGAAFLGFVAYDAVPIVLNSRFWRDLRQDLIGAAISFIPCYWVARYAYQGWYAPYEEYDKSRKISKLLCTAIAKGAIVSASLHNQNKAP